MPDYYNFFCTQCEWHRIRYRNLKKCPECRAEVLREDKITECMAANLGPLLGAVILFELIKLWKATEQ
jgi:hypothetical protein